MSRFGSQGEVVADEAEAPAPSPVPEHRSNVAERLQLGTRTGDADRRSAGWRWRTVVQGRRGPDVGFLVVLGALALLPSFASSYTVSTFTQILAFAGLCLSLHLLMGWTGMLSLGQAGYFGVGAYAVGLMATHHTTSAPVLLLVGAAAGAAAAALTGWLLVRSAGGYLLMITVAIGELLAETANSWTGLTGGDNGLAAIPFTTIGDTALLDLNDLYWYVFAVFVGCAAILYLVGRSPFGRTLRGIRDNEPRMRSLGYATYLYKYTAFVLAGAVAGIAGSVWVSYNQFVSPSDLGLQRSSMILVAVAVGGSRRLWGPLVGAAIVIASQDMLPLSMEDRGPLIFGLLLIAVVYVLPGGLTSLSERLGRLVRRA